VAWGLGGGMPLASHPTVSGWRGFAWIYIESFFASFFSKKEVLSF
jgi:hypothetical protein